MDVVPRLRSGPGPLRLLAVLTAVLVLAVALLTVRPGLLPAPAGEPATAGPALPTGPTGLDPSGATVPDTAYPIPAGAVFVATDGDDDAAGTEQQPVATLDRAVALAPEGGTIVFRAGVYHDWYHATGGSYRIVRKALTFQAYPHEQVWLDGTDALPASRWTRVAAAGAVRWSTPWSTPTFCDGRYYLRPLDRQDRRGNTGPCVHWDMAVNPSNPVAADPQQVWAGSTELREVAGAARVGPGTFAYDWTRRTLVVGDDPSTVALAAAARPVALVLGGGRDYVIRGVGFRRYAGNEYPNLTQAAVYIGGGTSLVENSVFTQNASEGLAYAAPAPGSVLRHSVLSRNGYTGLTADGTAPTGPPSNLSITGNVLVGNNAQRLGETCTASCGQAGMKLTHLDGARVSGNLVADTGGTATGIWCDLACSDVAVVHNVVRGQGGSGITYEVSDRGVIGANLVVGNRTGITVGSADTAVVDNTVVDNDQGLVVLDDPRSPGVGGWRDVGPDTRNVRLINNVVVGPGYALLVYPVRTPVRAPNTAPAQFFGRVESNLLFRDVPGWPVLVRWTTGSGAVLPADQPAALLADGVAAPGLFAGDRWFGTDGLGVEDARGSDGPLVGAGDYRVRTAWATGSPLPADLATVLRVPAGFSGRGAFSPQNR